MRKLYLIKLSLFFTTLPNFQLFSELLDNLDNLVRLSR